MFDDLQQVFGYRGAIDERAGASIVGPDLLVVPCWTPEFCATRDPSRRGDRRLRASAR